MLLTNILIDSNKIYNSTLTTIKNVADLQIGRTYIIVNTASLWSSNFYYHPLRDASPFKGTKEYKLISIKSITPKIDFSKIKNTITMDSFGGTSGMYFEDKEKFSLSEYLYDHIDGFFSSDVVTRGWIYYTIEYIDVLSNEIHSIDVSKQSYGIAIESQKITKKEEWKYDGQTHSANIDYVDIIYECSEYEYDKKYKNTKCISETKSLIKREVCTFIIENFKTFLAQTILANNDVIPEKYNIEIDGLTWFNGFYKSYDGVEARKYLFYEYIPRGWRLPTSSELIDLFKKHPLLRKELGDQESNKYKRALRNNVGMECYYHSTYIDVYKSVHDGGLNIMTLDSNHYNDENAYFPRHLKCFNYASKSIMEISPCLHTYNRDKKAYIIMLVKMSDDELKKQDIWVKNILDKNLKYKEIEDIYRPYGIDSLNDVEALSIDITCQNDNNSVKTFNRTAKNNNLVELKKAIAKYLGNNDVLKSTKLDITYSGNNVKGDLQYDDDKECDMRSFITKISPLLCKDLCINNVSDFSTLTNTNYYNTDRGHIGYVIDQYNKKGICSLNMFWYIKSALSMIGYDANTSIMVKSNSSWRNYDYISGTAYISKMIMTLKNGNQITINSLPVECFNTSLLYNTEVANLDNFSDNVIELKNKVMEKVNN